jgi:hypothetical protein
VEAAISMAIVRGSENRKLCIRYQLCKNISRRGP